MTSRIPTLDIRRYETDRDAFVAELGDAYREWGFAGIRGHGIAAVADRSRIRRVPALLRAAGRGEDEIPPRRQRRRARLHAVRYRNGKDSRYPDLKEFWHIGREIPRDSKYAGVMAPNVWPSEIPEFRPAGYGLYDALDTLGSRVLRALALHIDLPENYFDDKTNFGNSILRPIHYPPITAPDVPNVRAGAHEDINLITLLVGASAEGLEVSSRAGEWVPFTAEADTIVVNIGDMLQRLTNHVYPSTTHRVVNPPNANARKPRYSVPFFLHPNPDFVIDVLPSCVDATHPNRYPQPITAHEYLQERLREIKLI